MKGGISNTRRAHIDALHRTLKGPFTVREAATALRLPLAETRQLLSSFFSRGWLSRVRRGLYVTVPLGASAPSEWRADGWVVATKLFSPGYVGGWSACEHWSLTEQVFRDVLVFTTRPIRKSRIEIQGMPFFLRSIPASHLFGLTPVWRDGVKTTVSDSSRTLVDLLDDPSLGGGIAHVGEIVRAYFESSHRNDAVLLGYLGRFHSRSTYKRLGYIVESLGIPAERLLSECSKNQSQGLVALDPAVRARGRILKRWRLRVNVDLSTIAARS